ncbi:MAG TPA: winged helix DNA-binding protein [Cyclobacteriaceae bacterium]|jgi:DNA-binding MarR family transcriptional regulator|nr:winged helix DNA-binding protein [Cyclobacteriaceae bacterium]
MDKTIELVNLWGAFIKQHPEGSIEDFCRHLLIHQRESENIGLSLGGVVPMQTDGQLMKLIGRIHKLHVTYASAAFEGTPLNQLEEFGCLVTIKQRQNPKKSEVIYSNLMELSSGTDMLNRLKAKELITESDDQEDKRSKRVSLTPLGEKTVATCIIKVLKLAKMMLVEMSEDDKQLCIQLLKSVEIKFSALVQKHKGETFEDIYKELVSET